MLKPAIGKFSIIVAIHLGCFKLNSLHTTQTLCVQASNVGLLETLFTAPRSQIDLLMLTFIPLPWVTMSRDLTPSYRHC